MSKCCFSRRFNSIRRRRSLDKATHVGDGASPNAFTFSLLAKLETQCDAVHAGHPAPS
jgi:hypothetical protein